MLILLYRHERFHSTIEMFLELTIPMTAPYVPKLRVILPLIPIFREACLRPKRYHIPAISLKCDTSHMDVSANGFVKAAHNHQNQTENSFLNFATHHNQIFHKRSVAAHFTH